MRRLSLTLIASCGIALLSACNGGGYAFTGTNSNNTVTSVAFYNGSGQVNDFFVTPIGSAPIEINAVAQKGTGSQTQVVPDVKFTWNIGFAPAGTTYLKSGSPSGSGTCGTPANPNVPFFYSLLFQTATIGPAVPSPTGEPPVGVPPVPGDGSPQYPGYSILSPEQKAATIFVGAPLDPTKLPAVVPIGDATGSTNYCLAVNAIYQGATVGAAIVVVSNSP
jgi:hypothetical protein